MKFKVLFTGRKLGAIGKFEKFEEEITSEKNLSHLSKEDLHKELTCLYDRYQDICPIVARQIVETMEDDFGDEVTEARILPVGDAGNSICGIKGYMQEMQFRRERNKKLGESAQYDLPAWESLKVYFPA